MNAARSQAKSSKPAESALVAAGQQIVVLQTGSDRLNQKLQAASVCPSHRTTGADRRVMQNLERLGVKFTDDPKEHTRS